MRKLLFFEYNKYLDYIIQNSKQTSNIKNGRLISSVPVSVTFYFYVNWGKNTEFTRVGRTNVSNGLCRCWWRILETKCVGDNYNMLVTVWSPTSTCHQHTVTYGYIPESSPTSSHQHLCYPENLNFWTSTES